MIDGFGIVFIWFFVGVVMLAVVALWRSELRDMIKANIPGYGLTWRIGLVFICAILAFLWPVVLFGAVKRTIRSTGEKKEE